VPGRAGVDVLIVSPGLISSGGAKPFWGPNGGCFFASALNLAKCALDLRRTLLSPLEWLIGDVDNLDLGRPFCFHKPWRMELRYSVWFRLEIKRWFRKLVAELLP
jgi:hypothetical protein